MTLRVVQTKRDRLVERESAIIDAATDVYLKRGLDGATMAEIAKCADVADGTLYLYFKNKKALMMAVVAAHWERITREAKDSTQGDEGFFNIIEAHARYHISMLLREWKLIDLSFALYYTHRSKETEATDYKRAYVAAFDKVYSRAVDRGEIRDDVPLRYARDLFYGTLEYAARTLVLSGKKQEVDEVIENLMTVMRRGFEKRPRGGAAAESNADLADLTSRLEGAVEKLEQFNDINNKRN